MARTQIIPWFDRENYDAIRGLVGDDAIPDAFNEWLEATIKLVDEGTARGIAMEKVVIDPQQFAAWCLASGLQHNLTTLRAFSVTVARKQRDSSA
jgi:hypothetical protein